MSGSRVDVAELDRVIDQQPAVVFFCSPNNPTGNAENREVVLRCGDTGGRVGWAGRGRRGVRTVLLVVGAGPGGPRPQPGGVPDLLQDLGHGGRPARATWSGPSGWWQSWRRWCCRITSTRSRRPPACSPWITPTPWPTRVARLVEARGDVQDRLSQLDLDVWPSEANFILFRPRRRDAAEVWQGLVDRSVLVRDCSSWPRLEGCLRVTIGSAEENDRFLTALEAVLESPEAPLGLTRAPSQEST